MTRWCDLRRGDVLVSREPRFLCVIYILDDALEEKPGDKGNKGTDAVKFFENNAECRPIRADNSFISSSWEVFCRQKT